MFHTITIAATECVIQMLGRRRLDKPIMMALGDQFVMNYVEINGVVRTECPTLLATIVPRRAILVDQAVLFETKIDGRYAVGAMVLEAKRND